MTRASDKVGKLQSVRAIKGGWEEEGERYGSETVTKRGTESESGRFE